MIGVIVHQDIRLISRGPQQVVLNLNLNLNPNLRRNLSQNQNLGQSQNQHRRL